MAQKYPDNWKDVLMFFFYVLIFSLTWCCPSGYQSEFLAADMISLETSRPWIEWVNKSKMTDPVANYNSSDFLGQQSFNKRADPILQPVISKCNALEDYGKKDPTYASWMVSSQLEDWNEQGQLKTIRITGKWK